MDKVIKKINSYSDKKLQEYFNKTEIPILGELKLHLDNIYYNEGEDSGFSDNQYDMLKETLEKLDTNYNPTVGAKIRTEDNKVKLPFWLGSMDKFKPENSKEIDRWNQKYNSDEYIIEDKLDGVSCLVIFKNNDIRLYTRGDGYVGSDISHLAKYFNTIPKNKELNIAIRGELIIPIHIFEKKYVDSYKNARNMVSGIVNAKTIRSGIEDVQFIAYEIVGNKTMPKPSEQLDFLKKEGFNVVRHEIVNEINVELLIQTLLNFKKNSLFEIDGVIIQPNKEYKRNITGNPDYAFAFKMLLADNIIETTVSEVIWNVSKWGQLKPTIKIKPVKLSGVTITYTTGFNAKYIYENKIGEGAKIKITRSGDVIPYIVEVVKGVKEPEMPIIPWDWDKNKVNIITTELDSLVCIKLLHSFFEKLNVKELGEKRVAKLYINGLDTLLKIISAEEEDISNSEGIGKKVGKKIYNNIRNSLKNTSIPQVLGASGIFGFGIGVKRINKLFDDIPNILEESKTLSKQELYNKVIKVEGFSNITTQSIVDNIVWANKFIVAMKEYATFQDKKEVQKDLEGISVVITGARKHIQEQTKQFTERGGKVTGSVTKNTKYVVIGDEPGAEKIKKANELNIQIITIDEFLKKYF